MRVLVMGAGAIGGFVGAALARSGCDVTFVARGPQLEALRERGLEIRTPNESFTIYPVLAVESPAEAGTGFDLVLFTVKCYDTESAARALAPILGPETSVLTLQNGVDSAEQLGAIVGPDRVLAGTITIVVAVQSPGVAVQTGTTALITLGATSGEITARLQSIAEVLEAARLTVRITTDPVRAVWEKLSFLAPHAALTAACQATLGEIRGLPEGWALYRQLIGEVVAVGRACGVDLPADQEDRALAIIAGFAPTARSSLAMDYERGRRVELEQLAGTVVRRGRAAGVPTPGFDILYGVLKVRAAALGVI